MVTMSAGRDYTTSSRYEFCVFDGEELVAREGLFMNKAAAKRAGLRAAKAYVALQEAVKHG